MSDPSSISHLPSPRKRESLLVRAPWLLAIALFLFSLSAWIVFYILAQEVPMEKVPVQKESVLH